MSDRAVEAHPAPADADEPPGEPVARRWAPRRRHTVRLVATTNSVAPTRRHRRLRREAALPSGSTLPVVYDPR
jgi:hypothetical protein